MEKTELVELNTENVKMLWDKTYNTDGKPDWTHMFPYYHEEVIFQDSIQKINGKEDFVKMCKRLSKRSKELNIEILSIAQNDNVILLDWEMIMIFRRSPNTPIYGSTKLIIENNQIIYQRDYYDLWGDIYNGIPVIRRVYRWFMKKIFG